MPFCRCAGRVRRRRKWTVSHQPPTRHVRRVADLTLGSWRRTLLSAAVLAAVFAAVVAAGADLGDWRHSSFPGHPYPPPGYYRNPFSQDPGDLVPAAEAARVRADFLQDGRVELD